VYQPIFFSSSFYQELRWSSSVFFFSFSGLCWRILASLLFFWQQEERLPFLRDLKNSIRAAFCPTFTSDLRVNSPLPLRARSVIWVTRGPEALPLLSFAAFTRSFLRSSISSPPPSCFDSHYSFPCRLFPSFSRRPPVSLECIQHLICRSANRPCSLSPNLVQPFT